MERLKRHGMSFERMMSLGGNDEHRNERRSNLRTSRYWDWLIRKMYIDISYRSEPLFMHPIIDDKIGQPPPSTDRKRTARAWLYR